MRETSFVASAVPNTRLTSRCYLRVKTVLPLTNPAPATCVLKERLKTVLGPACRVPSGGTVTVARSESVKAQELTLFLHLNSCSVFLFQWLLYGKYHVVEAGMFIDADKCPDHFLFLQSMCSGFLCHAVRRLQYNFLQQVTTCNWVVMIFFS